MATVVEVILRAKDELSKVVTTAEGNLADLKKEVLRLQSTLEKASPEQLARALESARQKAQEAKQGLTNLADSGANLGNALDRVVNPGDRAATAMGTAAQAAQEAATGFEDMSQGVDEASADLPGIANAVEDVSGAMGQVAESADGAADKFKRTGDEADQSKPKLEDYGRTVANTDSLMRKAAKGVELLIKGFLALKAVQVVRSLADAAARVEVLGTTLSITGANAGLSATEINKMDEAVQSMGITARSSRQSLITLVQTGLITAENAEKAAKLARTAQDFAVSAGTDSSTTFANLVRNIQQMDTVGLRNQGVLLNLNQVYEEYAATLGKTADALSVAERQQGVLDAVLLKGEKVSGTYEAAMADVGKQIGSLSRQHETLSVAVGNILLPTYSRLVLAYTRFIKAMVKAASAMDEQRNLAVGLANFFGTLADSISYVAIKFVELKDVILPLVATLALIKAPAAIARIGALFAGATATTTAWNIGLLGTNARLGSIATSLSLVQAKLAPVAAGFALLARSALGLAAAAVGGYALGQLLRETSETARQVGNYLGLIPVILDAAYRSSTLPLKLLKRALLDAFNIGGVFDDEIEELDKAIGVIAGRITAAQQTVNYVLSGQDTNAADKLRRNIELAEDYSDQLTKGREELNALEARIAEAQENAKDFADEAAITGLEKQAEDARNRLRELEQILLQVEKLLPEDKAVKFREVRLELKVEEGSASSVTKKVEDEIAQAKKAAGIDKAFEFKADLQVSQGFYVQVDAIGKLVDNAKTRIEALNAQPITGDSEGAAEFRESLKKVNLQLAQAIARFVQLAQSAQTTDDILLAYNEIGPRFDDASARIKALKVTLQERLDTTVIKELDAQLEGFIARLNRLREVTGLIDEVNKTNIQAQREFQQALVDVGVSVDDARRGYVNLYGELEIFQDTTELASANAARATRESVDEITQAYKDDLAALEATNAQRKALIEERTGLEERDSGDLGKYLAQNIALEEQEKRDRLSLAKKHYDSLVELRSQSLQNFKEFAAKIKQLDQDRYDLETRRETALRDLKRKGLTEEEVYQDKLRELEELRTQQTEASLNQEYELARQLGERRISLAREIADAAPDTVSKQKALKRATEETKDAFSDQLDVVKSQRSEAVAAAQEQADAYSRVDDAAQRLRKTITSLAEKAKVEIIAKLDDASLENIKAKIEELANQSDPIRLKTDLDDSSVQRLIDKLRGSLSAANFSINVQANAQGGAIRRATGGAIRGPGSGTSDSILSWLSNGEYVIRAAAVQKYGIGFFDALNSMMLGNRIPAFALGGVVKAPTRDSKPVDVVNVNVQMGKRRASLMGERDQVGNLVSMLKGLETQR